MTIVESYLKRRSEKLRDFEYRLKDVLSVRYIRFTYRDFPFYVLVRELQKFYYAYVFPDRSECGHQLAFKKMGKATRMVIKKPVSEEELNERVNRLIERSKEKLDHKIDRFQNGKDTRVIKT